MKDDDLNLNKVQSKVKLIDFDTRLRIPHVVAVIIIQNLFDD